MAVRGKSIVHCHGKNKGKVIHTYSSHAAAVRAHKAMMAKRRKK